MFISLPLSLFNTVFLFWILKSLEDTKKHLQTTHQTVKFRIMQTFSYILFVGYFICLIAVAGDIYFKFSIERDELW